MLADSSEASSRIPALIDFGFTVKICGLLGTSWVMSGWIGGRMEDCTTSEKEHDIFALENMRLISSWISHPPHFIGSERIATELIADRRGLSAS